MKRVLSLSLVVVFVIGMVSALAAQGVSDESLWKGISKSSLRGQVPTGFGNPSEFSAFRLRKDLLDIVLKTAPQDAFTVGEESDVVIALPLPDGSYGRFSIKNSPIMEPELAAKYPMMSSYSGQGIDDPTATTRFDVTQFGFRAIILSTRGTVYIEPFAKDRTDEYISFDKQFARTDSKFACLFREESKFSDILSGLPAPVIEPDNLVTNGTMLRTYRLALAGTGEYTAVFSQPGDSDTVKKANALAAMMTSMNRVNGIYERELAIRMVIVANNDLVIYTDGATDPYTNNNGSTMLGENTTNLNNVIGTANYDIGHVFSTGGGGVASLNSPCGGSKARGVTGLTNPQGDFFDVDYVAHEMGHQWGGSHTFNGSSSNCSGGNRSASAAYEPGSGSTIQAYAGICTPQNTQRNSHDYFHVKSLEQMVAFSNGAGNCGVNTATSNTPPTVTPVGGTTFNVPIQTPFELTASGNDVNGDTLSYNWEEYDLGPADPVGGPPSATATAPVFRSYLSNTSPTRTFPSLPYVLNNGNVPPVNYTCNGFTCITGEILPAITRTMMFQVTARDNRAGGGGINTATVQVNVSATSGPFEVLTPATPVTWAGNSTQTVTWNAASTTAAPVSATNVKILLSTDGGQTFPTTILASTPNDGSQSINVPNIQTSMARIKIQGVSNIFFDVNPSNFTINLAAPSSTQFDFDGDQKADISIFRPGPGEWWYLRSSDNGNRAFQFGATADITVPADFTGDGIADVAFFRPSTGFWFVLRSDNTGFYSFPFGTNGDIPAPGDYDGDGKADPAVYRPSEGTWFVLRSSDSMTMFVAFGAAVDKPLVADYDNDGKDDIAVYKPDVAQFWQLRTNQGLRAYQFGAVGDKAMAADFSGDGTDDIAVWRPSTGFWLILRSEDEGFYGFPFGANGDIPAPADYDGDGKADPTVFRPTDTTWYSLRSASGPVFTGFGAAGDRAVPGSYVR